jgi:hypothetical protein
MKSDYVEAHFRVALALTSISAAFNYINRNGYFAYRQYNIQQFHVLPTHCIYVFCVELRTNSDYFPIQH